MAGRNDNALAAALQAIARAVGERPHVDDAGARSLATFQRENPPVFKGRYDPSGALAWLKEMERIFRVMDCTAVQKVRFGTHMLSEEADDWWMGCRQRLLNAEEEITWAVFSREFLRKYFPEDVRGRKEIEFLELKQGTMSVTEYATKFTELAKFHPHYSDDTSEFSKCIKFENGLRPDIKRAVGYQRIRVFTDLVDCCRIYEDDNNAHSRVARDQGNKFQSRYKPYESPAGRGKPKVVEGKKNSGGDAPSAVVCYKCGRPGHKSNACRVGPPVCYRCGKEGHLAAACERKEIVCFNCGGDGHLSSQCKKPKKERGSGRVFALVGQRQRMRLEVRVSFMAFL